MDKEEAIIRIKFLQKDDCTCPECEKNKEAYSVVLNYIEELEKELQLNEFNKKNKPTQMSETYKKLIVKENK